MNMTKGTDSIFTGGTLITGGAGFIGTNLADRLLSQGNRVIILDNLSRSGSERNWQWLRSKYCDRVSLLQADVRNRCILKRVLKDVSVVFHLAAQVAVTTSLANPERDFSINAAGTLILLETLHELGRPIPVVFTSSNKVYGNLANVELYKSEFAYRPLDKHLRRFGITESQSLEFASPYGCSKGCADQYVLDYARNFGVPGTVFRMSCIFGRHQFGNEDQGWVAHFCNCALRGVPITIYGDGCQVRDLLFIDDLIDAFVIAVQNMREMNGEAFNIGGGIVNSVSILEVLQHIEDLIGRKLDIEFSEWRHSDQRYYVTDFTKFRHATGWFPTVNVVNGISKLYHWLRCSMQHEPFAVSVK